MPIWHDPLDELIATLERAVPMSAAPIFDGPPPMEDHCVFGEWLLARDPARKASLAEDPRVKRVQAYYDRLGERWANRPSTPGRVATLSWSEQQHRQSTEASRHREDEDS